MNSESAWIKRFFDCKFPLFKKDVNLSEAKKILEEHKPDKLYKYRRADDHGFDVIETGALWLARADTVTDEYDCYYVYSLDKILDYHEQSLREALPNVHTSTVQQLRESRKPHIEADHDKLRDLFRKSIKLCSLCERADVDHMWKEYSGNNTGFCIEFDLQRVPQDLWEMLYPVFYTDDTVDLSAYNAVISRNKEKVNRAFIRQAALTKSLKWEPEREWRIIYPDVPEKIGVNCTGIPISCVYIGREASHATINRVTEICPNKGIAVKNKAQKFFPTTYNE